MQRLATTPQIKYSHILEDPQEWPIVKLSADKAEFTRQVTERIFTKIQQQPKAAEKLNEVLESTLHQEKLRIKRVPWNVDPDDDEAYWQNIQAELVRLSTEEDEAKAQQEREVLLKDIIDRYVAEICGSFKVSYFRFATKAVPAGFSRLLNASREGVLSTFSNKHNLRDKIHLEGEIDHLRALAKKGTIVMVPTHFSNIDSALMGYAIHELGLPPFIYGAGLNLFNIGLFGYFMNRLGAYKVDRRKKNPIYLQSLKEFSSAAMERGVHSLFFPGGTRSRSGRLERRLKLGLLNSVITAQRDLFVQATEGQPVGKIFVVPMVLNYHFTLEAPVLIRQYLQEKGQERFYAENDSFSSSFKIAKFLLKFFTKGSSISISVAKPLDVLGNAVDTEGRSLDSQGRLIETKDYFLTDGQLTADKQREDQYTRILAEKITDQFYRYNRVFSSHLVAFVAFRMLQARFPDLELYDLLRQPEEDIRWDYDEFRQEVEKVRERIFKLEEQGRVHTARHLSEPVDDVIKHGLDNVGLYHARRPLLRARKGGHIYSQNLHTLYYYHNRLDGYELERYL